MVALFVVLTFIIFLVADFFVLKAKRKEHPAFATMPVFNKSSIFIPLSYLLSKGHVWVAALQDNMYRLGIDEFILRSFGRVAITELAAAGTTVQKGDVIFRVKSGSKSISFRSPFDGEVREVNSKLLNKDIKDIYNTDWALTLKPIGNLPQELKSKKAAGQWLQDEVKRLKDFLSLQTAEPELAGLTMADGGNITEGAAHHLSDEAISKFEQSFLMQ
ncbi:MAG: glycine cleavage system protein H [Ignavibacteriales bacterium]|nr:glycine cleavage system protein H [Ignavibacteriales bacterium]